MEIIRTMLSADKRVVKFLQQTTDGYVVESTYVDRDEKYILCLSTQVGCVIGCHFCVSGQRQEKQYRRSLSTQEILDQCSHVFGHLPPSDKAKPILFSFMGEGEPLLNYDSCVGSFRELAKKDFGAPVRLAVSTTGIYPDLIADLGSHDFEAPLKVQISLHGSSDLVRSRLIKVRAPLAEILKAAEIYENRSQRVIEYNYVLCKDVNDDLENAVELTRILKPGSLVKFNKLNPTARSTLQSPDHAKVQEFRQILEHGGLQTEYYETDGSPIQGACGQLSYSFVAGNDASAVGRAAVALAE